MADTYQNLAMLYQSQRNHVQAEEVASKAFQTCLNVLGLSTIARSN
jgi:hypothetical protein